MLISRSDEQPVTMATAAGGKRIARRMRRTSDPRTGMLGYVV